ncbi:MAG: HEAT repeat domain-containing protein [Planctomycetota bacterium]
MTHRRLRDALRAAVLVLACVVASGRARAQSPSVDELAQRIRTELDAVPPQVFYDLATIGSEEALAVLRESLPLLSEDYQREYLLDACAVFTYGKAAHDGALAFLGETARRGAKPVDRVAAVRAMCAFDRDALEPLLAIARGSEDEEARRAAADGIAPQLLRGSSADDVDLVLDLALARPEPATTRRYVGVPRSEAKEYEKLTHRGVLVRATASMRDGPVLEHVLDRLATGRVTPAWRLALVEGLGDRPQPTVVRTLAALLREPDPALVLQVLEKLAAHRERGAWDDFDTDLPPLLSSKDAAVRAAAVFALGAFGVADPRWRTEVLELSRSKDAATRQGAARALGELRTPEAIARLHELVGETDWTVRYSALKALERLRLPESVPVLVARIEHETRRMRDEIDFTLRMLTGVAVGPTHWAAWLADQGEITSLPSHEEAVAAENERRGRETGGEGGSTVGFFDIRVTSDRVVFVCDMSSSMEEPAKEVPRTGGSVVASGRGKMTRFELAKLQLLEVLRAIPDDTLFNVLFFSHRIEPYDEHMARMKRTVRARATKWVREQFPDGSTDVYSALELAFLDPAVDTVYLLTDGHPTDGPVTDPGEIRARVAHWNRTRHVVIHSISLGRHSDLLEGLASDSGGSYREFL